MSADIPKSTDVIKKPSRIRQGRRTKYEKILDGVEGGVKGAAGGAAVAIAPAGLAGAFTGIPGAAVVEGFGIIVGAVEGFRDGYSES